MSDAPGGFAQTSKVVLIGSGGHARVLIEAIEAGGAHRIVGAVDVRERLGRIVDGVKVVGTEEDLPRLLAEGASCAVLAVGSVGDTAVRHRIAGHLREVGFELPAIVHPDSYVAANASIGEGAFVAAGSVVGAGATVEDFAIINTGAVVDHDCVIGEFAHVAPGCALSGAVKVGADAHLGTGASVIQGLTIGRDAMIGAGSVVTDDVPDGVVAYGNPCRVVRETRS